MPVLKNRYTPIIGVCGALALLIAGGHFIPTPSEALPVRISMRNKGGNVVFTHARHLEYVKKLDGSCETCHHEKKMRGMTLAPVPCGSCHATEFDAKFSSDHQASLPPETCTYCHHAELGKLLYSHEDHAAQHDCTECHHGPDIEAEPGACNQCHGAEAEENMPSLREAVHAKCNTCHEDMFEEQLKGCKGCHEILPGKAEGPQPSCNSCHFETDATPLLTRMDSYHDQCMDCHEKAGAGPYGEDSCNRCHTR
ncbi:cytochrome c3 family protein [Desulfomicrobium orale]|uniref:Class III cytochrome C domain-containing protein n=1 Tax=Desulfomicrobium orale DSM 12838 TaxID=888061 RepID=A0A109W5Y3_9BACT|nr:cytochrome c3 family protein [Desulfomicrobium orale]AMD92913.1 hypothetical protein AXF15_07225 [Desulfomicrobium orale DSM 12838]